MTTELKPCPCGIVPEKLCINQGSTYRWRVVDGDCCGRWEMEVRVNYERDEAKVREICEREWNAAPRPSRECVWERKGDGWMDGAYATWSASCGADFDVDSTIDYVPKYCGECGGKVRIKETETP